MNTTAFIKQAIIRFTKRLKCSSFDYRRFPRNINLGCGLDKRPDYLNVDLQACHQPDLITDAARLGMLPDGYYRHILASDVLEHIERPRILNTLKEWNRILEIGGTLAFRVPCAEGILDLLTRPENQTVESQQRLLQCLFGSQTYEGDYHHIAFTRIILEYLLDQAGFHIISLEIKDIWLFNGLAKKCRNECIDPMYALSDNRFLDAVYQSLLGRPADRDGKRFYRSVLRRGVLRESVVEAIRNSPEYRSKHGDGSEC